MKKRELEEQENNKTKKSVVGILKSERLKSALGLCFYLVMIVLLVLAIRANKSNKNEANKKDVVTEVNEQTVTSQVSGFTPIKRANYKYNYTVTIDDNNYIYSGIRYNDKQQLSLTDGKLTNQFYIISDIALTKKNSDYVLSDIPYYYINYFDTGVLEKILLSSTYDEKKDTFTISNKFLDIITGNKENSTDETLNYISISYKNKNIDAIEMDVTNYVKSRFVNVKKVVINLSYSDFGLVEDFEIGE